jgi:ribosomal protein L11 methyltransferase
MEWIECTVHTTHQAAEAVAAALMEEAYGGVVVRDKEDLMTQTGNSVEWDYMDPAWLEGLSAEVLVQGYLPSGEEAACAVERIRRRVADFPRMDTGLDLGSLAIEVEGVDSETWVESYKQYFKPRRVTESLVIKPSWAEWDAKDGDQIIEIDPGSAFGTGAHASTFLCLQQIENNSKPGMNVLDIGCGTGILSIGAARLGAAKVDAVEIDPHAVTVARENVARNHLTNTIQVRQGDLAEGITGPYDMVVANIIADVIIRLAPDILSLLKSEGVFIGSGIIDGRVGDVVDALRAQGLKTEIHGMEEWAVVVARRG